MTAIYRVERVGHPTHGMHVVRAEPVPVGFDASEADAYLVPVDAVPAPSQEVQIASLRAKRNRSISECDWTQLPDAPLTEDQREAWAAYRQALRDVPQQGGAPYAVVWPVPPNAR
jgi:hypothetical protein